MVVSCKSKDQQSIASFGDMGQRCASFLVIVDDVVDACHVNMLSSSRGVSSSWLNTLLNDVLDLSSIGSMEHERDGLLPEWNNTAR